MAATNFTPIQLYFSTTASAVPLAANLAQGELAINITDGKLYYEDNGGVVQVIATKGAGTIGGSTTQIQYNNAGALAGNAAMTFNSATSTTTLTTLNLTNALGATYGGTAQSSYTQGDILYSSATNTLSKLGIGTVNYILTSSGSVPQWSAPSSIIVQTATNLAGGLGGSVPYQSAVDTTTFLAIGAANRVMTSSGTAPQWVTSLTGLTGVSSSSITNTSLTSGRVVVSTTAGLQADDADLTFDGTTLSAGGYSTVGLTTLVKTVKIGDSNFSGVAVFAPSTPAKLYLGTGTVTDTTSAIGATNATGAIASLAITPIAATNTSVTYTNAATLYIAGAPSAGTNVTLTNPYALYVAAGDAYFGGTVTAGTVNLTTLDLTNLEVTNIKAKDGTAAMTIADSTGVVSFTANPILSGGTANGVLYLNGSKVATSGSALTFNGTTLSLLASTATMSVKSSTVGSNSVVVADTSSTDVASLFRTDINGTTTGYIGAGGATYPNLGGNNSLFLWNVANGPVVFATNNTGRGRFDSSGRFFVGLDAVTTSSSQSGEVYSTGAVGFLFTNTTAANYPLSVKNQGTTGTRALINFYEGAGGGTARANINFNGSNDLTISTSNNLAVTTAGITRFTLDTSGRVGFGSSGALSDRLADMSFSSAITAGTTQFGIVLNPTYPTTATTNIFNLYTGPNLTPGTTCTNVYNLYLEVMNTAGSTVTNRYAIYQASTVEKNYFGGNVGIGFSAPDQPLAFADAIGVKMQLNGSNSNGYQIGLASSVAGGDAMMKFTAGETGAGEIGFYNTANLRMLITQGGLILVGEYTHTDGSMFYNTSNTTLNAWRGSANASDGLYGVYSNVGGSKTVRGYFRCDGGLANYSANNVNLSDERLKKDIALAGNYLDKICAIPVKNFRYKDQSESEDITLGVIAQDVLAVAPELVSQEGFGLDSKEDFLSIYQTDIQYALMKCIQEQQAIILSLKARLDAANL